MPTQKYKKFENAGRPSFEEAWKNYIMPIKGATLQNSRGTNKIIEVNQSGIIRETCTGNKDNKISINKFQFVYDELVNNGSILRMVIDQQLKGRCSSGIVLILGEALPFVQKETKPLRLRLI